MKSIKDYQVGDVITITSKMKRGVEVRSAIVDGLDYDGNGQVRFQGYSWKELPQTGCGSFDPQRIGTKPFGIMEVRVVGHVRPSNRPPWQPHPGDTGYDLM